MQQNRLEDLDQFDYNFSEYLDKAASKYSSLIGKYLIYFSILEGELNIAISDYISQRSHETGLVIIEKLTMLNKIELFYKMYLRLESIKSKGNKSLLSVIRKNLEDLNTFRNNIVHANWATLNRDGYVRTKVIVDNQEGVVKFRMTLITPKIIRENTKQINKTLNLLEEYLDKAWFF